MDVPRIDAAFSSAVLVGVDPWYQVGTDQRDIFCFVRMKLSVRTRRSICICNDESKAVVYPGGGLMRKEKPQRTTAASQQYSYIVQEELARETSTDKPECTGSHCPLIVFSLKMNATPTAVT